MIIPDGLIKNNAMWLDLTLLDQSTKAVIFPTLPIKWRLMGTYILFHPITESFYFGSSKNVMRRLYEHRNSLVVKKNNNRKIQKCFEINPDIKVMVFYTETRDEAYDLEQKLVDANLNNEKMCNIGVANVRIAGLGHIYTDAEREVLRIRSTGRKHTEESKHKISIANSGKSPSLETRAKQRAKLLGKKVHSPEGIQRIKLRMLGNKIGLGRKHTEEAKRNISEKQKGIPKSKEMQEKYRLARERNRLNGFYGKHAKKVSINNVIYPTVRLAAASINMGTTTVTTRVKSADEKWKDYFYVND